MSSPPQNHLAELNKVTVSNEAAVRDVPAIVGKNLKRLRKAQGYSLDRLAELSKVSRAMLGQIETEKSVPTVSVLWKIADALGVSVSNLLTVDDDPPIIVLRRNQTAVVTSGDGHCKRRALFQSRRKRLVDFFELSIDPGHIARTEPLPNGGEYHLVVVQGELVVTVGCEPAVRLAKGDAATFDATIASSITNDIETIAVAFTVLVHGS